MPHLSTNGVNWIFTLAGSVFFSLLGLAVPNFYKQIGDPRAHNNAKLLNEFLARHQLIYVTYFLALSITAKFSPRYDWMQKAVIPMMGLILVTYVAGVYLTVIQDKHRVFASHGCPAKGTCAYRLSGRQILSLAQWNAIAGIGLLILAVLATFTVA